MGNTKEPVDPTYLIVGASGFIGSHLYARLGRSRTIATYHRTPIPGGVHFDVERMRLFDTILRGKSSIRCAFLLGGMGNLDDCARDPEGSERVNVAGTLRMIDDLEAVGVKTIFTSSDAVFDGERGSLREDDPPNPILTYGRQKVMVENYLAKRATSWVVARLSKVVGTDPGPHSLIGGWFNDVESGATMRCASDLIFAPITVDDTVTALIRLADGEFGGIYNVCGPRSMSRQELLEIFLAEVRRYRTVDITVQPCSIRDFPFLEARPLDGSMVPDKLYSALGTSFESMESYCRRVVAERAADRWNWLNQ